MLYNGLFSVPYLDKNKLSLLIVIITIIITIFAAYISLKIASSFKMSTPFSVLATVPPPSQITGVRARGQQLNQEGIRLNELMSLASTFVLDNSFSSEEVTLIHTVNATLTVFFDATLIDYLTNTTRSLAVTRAWLYIKTFKGRGPYFWHRDYPFGGSPGVIFSRYSMTLIGIPTAVLLPTAAVDAAVNSELPFFNIGTSRTLSRQPRETISTGQIYRFTMGKANSPVHSTPIHPGDRIFVSVVYY
jgi:hypothetical protein